MRVINPYKMFKGAFIPNALMEHRGLSQSAKLLWARLAQYAGRDGRCFPSLDKLADDIGLSRSMIRKVVKELKDNKFIAVKHASGKDRLLHQPSEYFFLDHPIFYGDDSVRGDGPIYGQGRQPINGPSKDSPSMGSKDNQLRKSVLNVESGKIPDEDDQKIKKFHGSDKDLEIAKEIYEAVLVVNQTVKEPNFDKWANDIRLMRVQDGRSYDDILRAFFFANRDPFWSNNVLSTGALRRHYVKLAPRAGMVRSQVRGVSADVVDTAGKGKVCGECIFCGQGKAICNGDDADHGHSACDLFRSATEEE